MATAEDVMGDSRELVCIPLAGASKLLATLGGDSNGPRLVIAKDRRGYDVTTDAPPAWTVLHGRTITTRPRIFASGVTLREAKRVARRVLGMASGIEADGTLVFAPVERLRPLATVKASARDVEAWCGDVVEASGGEAIASDGHVTLQPSGATPGRAFRMVKAVRNGERLPYAATHVASLAKEYATREPARVLGVGDEFERPVAHIVADRLRLVVYVNAAKLALAFRVVRPDRVTCGDSGTKPVCLWKGDLLVGLVMPMRLAVGDGPGVFAYEEAVAKAAEG